MKNYLVNKSTKTGKFWQIELKGMQTISTYGKLNTTGKETVKNHKTAEKAFLHFKAQTNKKILGGYSDPKQPFVALESELSPYNELTFYHNGSVDTIHYIKELDCIISGSKNTFYLFTTDGKKLDEYQFQDSEYFHGDLIFNMVPNSSRIIVYVKSFRLNKFFFFDLTNQKLELEKSQEFNRPEEGYYVDVKVTGKEIWLGYSNGFSILNHDLETISSFTPSQKKENSNGVAVNPTKEYVAFAEYGGRDGNEQILITDKDGNKISEFSAKCHGGNGMMIQFDTSGEFLVTAYSQNYKTTAELWNPKTGERIKELSNYSSSGGVLSLQVSDDGKYIMIRPAGVDLILWDVGEETVKWTKRDQALYARISFVNESYLLKSVGNRIFKMNMEDGEVLTKISGLADDCKSIYYHDENDLLWIASGKIVNAFDTDGNIRHTLEGEQFSLGTSGQLLIDKRGSNVWEKEYNWLDLATKEKKYALSGHFNKSVSNEKYIVSSESYFSRNKKCVKLWSHNGKLIKELKLKDQDDIALLKQDMIIAVKGNKVRVWDIMEDELRFEITKPHASKTPSCSAHDHLPYFVTYNEKQIKLFGIENDNDLLFEFTLGKVIKVSSYPYLASFIVFDEEGYIYEINPKEASFRIVAHVNNKFNNAYINQSRKLIITALDRLIYQLDFPYLNYQPVTSSSIEDTAKAVTLDYDELEKEISSTHFVSTLENTNWEYPATADDFLRLRDYLQKVEQQEGISAAHHFFTEKILANKGILKHDFAQVEELKSFGISPDGKYLAVGTWVGEDYDTGGTLQIWETATGKCVNMLKESYGGIGWPDYPDCIQWSPDSRHIGAAFNTNGVGKFDPFSDNPSPLSQAYVTDGWSRPPSWCWLADGKAFMISAWGNGGTPGGICRTDIRNCYEDDTKWFSKTLEKHIKSQVSEDDLQPYKWSKATPDGKLVYGYNRHSQIYAIDLKTKKMVWFRKLPRQVVCGGSDSYFLHYNTGKRITAYHVNTGKRAQVIDHDDSVSHMCISPDSSRLAVVSGTNITIYTGFKKSHSFSIANEPMGFSPHYSELRPFSFSPDASHITFLCNTSKVETWSLGKTAKLVHSFSVPTFMDGIYLTSDRVVTVGGNGIGFWNYNGQQIHIFNKDNQTKAYNELYQEVNGPLHTGKYDLAEDFDINPNYPFLGKEKAEWLVALKTGLVISSSEDPFELDKYLSIVWNGQYTIPYRWMEPALYSNTAEAMDDPKCPFNDKEKALFKTAKKKPTKKGISFKKGGSKLDIIKLHLDSEKELSSGWSSHLSDYRGYIAEVLIKEFEAYERAIKIVNQSTEWHTKVENLGKIAILMAKKGETKLAQKAVDLAISRLDDSKEWAATYVYSPLAAACHLLENVDAAKEYFQKARTKIEDEANSFQKYCKLATAYAEIGDYKNAEKTLLEGPWDGSYLNSYIVNFILKLIEEDEIELVERLVNHCIEKFGDVNEFKLLDGGFDNFLAKGDYTAAQKWMEKFDGLSTSSCEARMVEHMLENSKKEVATTYLKKEIAENGKWANTLARNIRELSKVNPEETAILLKDISLESDAYYQGEYYADIAKACANLPSIPAKLKLQIARIKKPNLKFQFIKNLLSTGKHESYYEAFISMVEKENLKIEEYLEISKIAALFNKEDGKKYFDKSLELAKNVSDSDDFASIQNFYLEAEEMELAYKIFKKQKPSDRRYNMKSFVLHFTNRGYWKTAVELLKTLPAKDLNDRHSATMKIIKPDYY